MGRKLAAGLVAAILAWPLFGWAQDPAAVCANGAGVKAQYCKFVLHYDRGPDHALDFRISDSLGVTSSAQTRSIALIIAIDSYPNLPAADLSAASVDRERLQDYLVKDQGFDEVIVLRNADATTANIRYFLNTYLLARGDDFVRADGQHTARLLIAYSGHGRPETDRHTRDAAFLLADADGEDSPSAFPMIELNDRVKVLSDRYFHVLTLVNACYGGNTFTSQGGGNGYDETAPGSYVITAGDAKKPVWALKPARGSIFFDLVISGLEAGVADRGYFETVVNGEDGQPLASPGGIARTMALASYLDTAYLKINNRNRHKKGFVPLSRPWYGPAQNEGAAMGGFFFLSGPPKADAEDPSATYTAAARTVQLASLAPLGLVGPALSEQARDDAVQIPAGPISSLIGRPDVKVFKAPKVYPIHGFDVSSQEGAIDWKAFGRTKLPRFLYVRAVGWRGRDRRFEDRWTHAAALGVDRGMYLKFDFCLSAAEQLARLVAFAPNDPTALPVAIELVEPQSSDDRRQAKCYASLGKAGASAAMLELATAIQAQYGKVPLIYGNRYNLSLFTDTRFDRFMLWLGSYGAAGTALRLPGRNPWTLWQYSGSLKVPGLGDGVTGDVFFGTAAQYDLFKQGRSNVALDAVTRDGPPG